MLGYILLIWFSDRLLIIEIISRHGFSDELSWSDTTDKKNLGNYNFKTRLRITRRYF